MRPTFVKPPDLFAGAPYAYAAVAPAGALVFAAGACPLDANGGVVAPGDHEEQMRRALANLRVALEAAGSTIDRVVKTTVYVVAADQDELVRAWKVVERAFAPASPPSTLVGVARLGYTGQLVEIDAVATATEPGH
jgi:enamine deaminase RidA (YjgF/YER057c/UK114 family)